MQSFGMFNIHKDRILFELSLAKKKEGKRRERKRMNKIEIFKFGLLDLVSRTFWTLLAELSGPC